MKFNFLKTEPKEILDFEKEIGVELLCEELPAGNFQVRFEKAEISNFIVCSFGKTIDEALENYCRSIRFAKIKATNSNKVIDIPNLIHTRKVEIPKEEKPCTPNGQIVLDFFNDAIENSDYWRISKSVDWKVGFKQGVFEWLNSQDKTRS